MCHVLESKAPVGLWGPVGTRAVPETHRYPCCLRPGVRLSPLTTLSGFRHPHPTITGGREGVRAGLALPLWCRRGGGRQTRLTRVSPPEPAVGSSPDSALRPLEMGSSPLSQARRCQHSPRCGQTQEGLWQETWGKPTVVSFPRTRTRSQHLLMRPERRGRREQLGHCSGGAHVPLGDWSGSPQERAAPRAVATAWT